ncbi:MAG: hypothetical protein M3430_10790 [Acidobacteriota bacterium]|nr:hypothetical protein [Acidobacteriota bacterium]
MIAVTGIFISRDDAERAVERLRSIGIADNHIALLAPGMSDEAVEETVTESMPIESGAGEKVGGALGRGLGLAGGMMLGGALGSFFVPGVGAVFAAGVLGAALLGTGGAAVGAAAGHAIDETSAANLRHDDLHLYEAALRQGRTVLVALVGDEEQAAAARARVAEAGAESLDEARANWWRELRAAEEEAYATEGRDFAFDEALYRRGFEAALHPHLRSKSSAEAVESLRASYGDDYEDDAFRRGYERGQTYHQDLLKKFPPKTKNHVNSSNTPDA